MQLIYNFIQKRPKTTLLIAVVLIVVIVIALASFMNNLSRKQSVKMLEDQKQIEIRIRDEALDTLQVVTEKYKDSLQVILNQDKEIRYVPGRTKKIYVDRNIDSAIIILQRSRYMVQ